jgi:hypothetical protein
MNDAEKVTVLKSALEQLISETQHLLSRFKAQVSLETEQTGLSPERLQMQHQIVCQSIATEWELIRTLYMLLASSTKERSTHDLQDPLQPIEALLEKLKEGQNPFKHHEFQFPFHLSSMVSSIKTAVKNYILQIAPKEVQNCDLFTPTTLAKSPRKIGSEAEHSPIQTNNVKQAAKRFEKISENIAESANKLKKPQTTKRTVTKVNKAPASGQMIHPIEVNPYQTAFDAIENELNSAKITEKSAAEQLETYVTIPETPPPSVVDSVASIPAAASESTAALIRENSTSKPMVKKVAISDKSLAYIAPGIIRSTSNRSFQSVDNGQTEGSQHRFKPLNQLEAEVLHIQKVPEHAIVRKMSTSSVKSSQESPLSGSTITPNSPERDPSGMVRSRTPVTENETDNPFRSSTASRKSPERSNSIRTAEIQPSAQTEQVTIRARPVFGVGKESSLGKSNSITKNASYSSTIQNLVPNAIQQTVTSISPEPGPSTVAQAPVLIKKQIQPPKTTVEPNPKISTTVSQLTQVTTITSEDSKQIPQSSTDPSSIFDLYDVGQDAEIFPGRRKSSIQSNRTISKYNMQNSDVPTREQRADSDASVHTITKPQSSGVTTRQDRSSTLTKNPKSLEPTENATKILTDPAALEPSALESVDLSHVSNDLPTRDVDQRLVSQENLLLFGKTEEQELQSRENLLKDSVDELSIARKEVQNQQISGRRESVQQEKETKLQRPLNSIPPPLPLLQNSGGAPPSPSVMNSTISPAPPINKSTKPTRKISQATTPSFSGNPTQQMMDLKRMTMQVAKRRQDIASVMISEKDYILNLISTFTDDPNASLPEVDEVDSIISRTEPRKKSDEGQTQRMDMVMEMDDMFDGIAVKKPEPLPSMLSPMMQSFDRDDASTPINHNSSFDGSFLSNVISQSKTTPPKSKKRDYVSDTQTFHMSSKVFDPTSSAAAYIDDKEQSTITLGRLNSFNNRSKYLQLLMIPLNGMFDMRILDLSQPHRFGRNNTTNHPCFKAFGTLVVSRNHLDIFAKDGKVFIKDIGSNSGTFRNNARLSQPAQVSIDVELLTGDYIQLGKDFTQGDDLLDEHGRVQARKRCVRLQVVVIQPGQTAAEAIQCQRYSKITIEFPLRNQ